MDTIEQQFEEFYANIKLTSAQRQDAIDKHTGVCNKLHDNFYPNITYNGSTKLLVGSYGKHTNIRPARDVDVIFIMPSEKFAQYNEGTSNRQSQLLQDIKSILKEKYPNTPISSNEKIVKLEFSETKHDVELIPAWEDENGIFTIPNSTNVGSWETQDYRKEISDILESDNKTGKTKFLIRCIKKWSDNCTANVRTYEIEKTILNFFLIKDTSGYSSSKLIKEFFEYFHQQTYDEGLKSHISTALNRAKKAYEFEQDDKLDDATEEWKKIFGNDFPKNIKSISLYNTDINLTLLQDKYPSQEEDYIENYHEIDLNPSYFIEIDTHVPEVKGFRAGLLSNLMKSSLFKLVKHMSLNFKVTNCNVPENYDVKWKIRNFGDEAMKANKLRGEIIPDEGFKQRKEDTQYIGQHYVECYIIKDNKCVAIGHTPVPIGDE